MAQKPAVKFPSSNASETPPKESVLFEEVEAHCVSFTMKPGKEGQGPTCRVVFDMPSRNDGGRMMSALRRMNKDACVLRIVHRQLQFADKKIATDPMRDDEPLFDEGGGD